MIGQNLSKHPILIIIGSTSGSSNKTLVIGIYYLRKSILMVNLSGINNSSVWYFFKFERNDEELCS